MVRRLWWLATLGVLWGGAALAAEAVSVTAPTFTAAVRGGTLDSLKAFGHLLVGPGPASSLTGLLRVGGEHWAQGGAVTAATLKTGGTTRFTAKDLTGLPGSTLTCNYTVSDGELVVTQQAQSPQAGVHSVQWGLGVVPFAYDIIVPGRGGIRIRRDSPGSRWDFGYPIGWEAQFVALQGPGHGFYVWAEDPTGRFKDLRVRRTAQGWTLAFATQNAAPFAPCTSAVSVRWRLGVYKGDWRVAARKYRDWTERVWQPTRLTAQQPAWVKDIRFVVIMGQDRKTLQVLAQRVDPKQTLLYLPDWRSHGYDRMYPDYTANDDFPAFVREAHQLGFKVMPHVNYFGCDPLSPEYAAFEKYQVRSPWTHEREWWLWERAKPTIKFAYISPACKAWRELQIARWKELVARYQVDALHLDQTLCMFNDDNGLIDGMTMVEGNWAIHRELRAALPQVAISGEGLDEITARYEAFAQRHSHGLDFVEGTWDRPHLVMAHPISSYLFGNFTQPYGYLGMVSPANGQLYAAWRENYQHWGVLPTLRAYGGGLEQPTGFTAQVLAEAAAFAQYGLSPDLDGPWPPEVHFPYHGTPGVTAAYRNTGSGTAFVVDSGGKREEITRIVTGVSEVKAPGSIAGWRCYDAERLLGLRPEAWYPYSATPRDLRAFHVSALPEGYTASRLGETAIGAVAEFVPLDGALVWLAERLNDATSGSVADGGKPMEMAGPLDGSPDGALFNAQGRDLHAHPPWKATRVNPQTGVTEAVGTGQAYTRVTVDVPVVAGAVWFRSEVAMDKGAVGEGKTDGVVYRVRAEAPGKEPLTAEVLAATTERQQLGLDLSPLKGQKVALTLSVDPGPRRQATFDWARWYGPRLETKAQTSGEVTLAGLPEYACALDGDGLVTVSREGDTARFRLQLPGALFLLKQAPAPTALPLDLALGALQVSFLAETGETLVKPQYAGAGIAATTVGGVSRAGLSTHPPDHGQTVLDYALQLPADPARFHAWVGLRDGSVSEGCGFRVRVNGREIGYRHMLPGKWEELSADLTPWAGKPVVLSLSTDSEGSFSFDWGAWGEPKLSSAKP